jgi:hypothetical protein
MSSCACQTARGTRCTLTVQTGSKYCHRHQRCESDAPEDDYVVETTAVINSSLRALSNEVKMLVRERNFYYRKLVRVSEFADTLRAKERERLHKILSSQKP